MHQPRSRLPVPRGSTRERPDAVSGSESLPPFTLVVPCYNEAGRFDEFGQPLVDFAAGLAAGSELIFVDDGSDDPLLGPRSFASPSVGLTRPSRRHSPDREPQYPSNGGWT